MNTTSRRKILYPLILINIIFFLLGFIWNMGNVLVGLFQDTYQLTQFETSFVPSVSFLAFFIMSYPAGLIIQRLGPQRSITLGALIASFGLLLFIPVALISNYYFFLVAFFIIFSGVTILQIVCNPLVGSLGSEETGASRINFSQGLGAMGAFFTPILGGRFILELFEGKEFLGIRWFYLALGVAYALIAILIKMSKLPDVSRAYAKNEEIEQAKSEDKVSVWKYPNFVMGFIIMFLYMGSEAILYQLMTPYFKEVGGIDNAQAVRYTTILFLGLMLGRLSGAGLMLRLNPSKILGTFAAVTVALLVTGMFTDGKIAIYAITATGFFISIMFASIFSVSIFGLGKHVNKASSLLIMGISGGFFVPLIYGSVASMLGLRISFIVVIIPLLLASWFGFRFAGLLKRK